MPTPSLQAIDAGRAVPRWLWLALAATALALVVLGTFEWVRGGNHERREALRHAFQNARGDLARAVVEADNAGHDGGGDAHAAAIREAGGALARMQAALEALGGDGTRERAVAGHLAAMRASLAGAPGNRSRLDAAFVRASPDLEAWLADVREVQADSRRAQSRGILAILATTLALVGATAFGLARSRAAWRLAGARIDRLTRLRQAQSRINGALIREADFAGLADTVCRIAVGEGGLECAVVRLHHPGDDTLRPLAWHAPRTGLIGREVVPVSDDGGIAAATFMQRTAMVIGDMTRDPLAGHANATAVALGVHSAAAFPLLGEHGAFGTFALFGAGRDFFDAEIVALLRETADSLAFAHDRLAAARALHESETRYRTLVESTPDAIAVISERGVEMVNRAARHLLGRADGEVLDIVRADEYVAPAFRERGLARLEAALFDRVPQPAAETAYLRADGSIVPAESVTIPFDYAGRPAALIIARDLTARRLAEERIGRLDQLRRAQSRINEAVMRESDFAAVAAAVCRIAVEVGGVKCALVRTLDAASGLLLPLAWHGPETGLIGRHELPATGDQGVSTVAFATGRSCVIDDMQASPVTVHGAERALAHGVRSAAGFPLLSDGRAFGSFAVFGPGEGYFDAEMAALLDETAKSLAFARDKMAAEAARAASERDLLLAQEAGRIGVVIVDADAGTWSGSPVAFDILGVPPAPQRPLAEFYRMLLPGDGAAGVERAAGNVASTTRTDTVYRVARSDGGARWVRVATDVEPGASGTRRRIGTVQDVTDIKEAEQSVLRLSHLYAALSRTNAAIARETEFAELAATVCRIAVEEIGMISATVRLHDGTALVSVAAAGTPPKPLDRVHLPVDDPLGVAPLAFRQRTRVVIDDIAGHPATAAVAAAAALLGIHAIAAFPLAIAGGVVGTLSLSAGATASFDGPTADLVGEIADALAFAHGKLKADATLRDSEARYRTLVDNTPDALRIVCDGRVVMVNPAYERLFGTVAPGASFDALVLEHLAPETRTRAAARMRAVVENGHVAPPDEQVMARADGSPIAIEATTAPFVFDGRPAALTIIRDLSERHARERAVREGERRFRSMVENSMAGVAILHEGVFEYVNPGLVAVLGYASADGLIGRPALDTVLAEDRPGVAAVFATLGAEPGLRAERQRLRMCRADGAVLDVLSSAASIEVEGRVLVQAEVRDISRERRARAELEALNRELEDRVARRTAELTAANRDLEVANRHLESFSYSVAHDLRAPLRSMAGFASLLEIDVAERKFDAVPQHVARITQNAARMNALVDGLLAVARVTHNALVDAPVDMQALVAETVRDTQAGPNVRFEIGSLPAVRGDAATLRQVWANLIANAIKYSARATDPMIAVDATRGAGECEFRVRDNGAGFDPAYADRLFGVFQRLHTSREFEGTGVGLAVVRRIVERHGGRVWAEGRPGAGATFHFALPAVRILPGTPARSAAGQAR